MSNESDQRPILIAGPTAGGKSGLALRLAERYDGIVINADSMQVYRDLAILTARPSVQEEARVPHALYGFVAGAEPYSAGRYAADVARALKEARSAGRRPIIVGGTGLYFKTLIEGLSPMPQVPDAVRAHWRAQAAEAGSGELHRILSARDPEMAQRLKPGDTQRIVRALEVLDASGASLLAWQRGAREPVLDAAATVRIVVAPERGELNGRIETRFAAMMAAGALEEAARLGALGLDPALPVMNALGVRPLLRHLAGKLTRKEAVAAAQTETRQYAKRQLTWGRGNMITWKWISTKDLEFNGPDIVSFIDP
jgi:tRNA dimethylallyltransferase